MRTNGFRQAQAAVELLELPEAVFKTCHWEPRELIITGLRQRLRCCAAGIRHRQALGMPSHAVDEAWHGLILCTRRYESFCTSAYGMFMHHTPSGGGPSGAVREPMHEQLRRTVIAWSLVAMPGEECVLWDLDQRVGVDHPWGLSSARIAEIESDLAPKLHSGRRSLGLSLRGISLGS